MTKRMRDLPAINKILEHPEIIDLIERYSLNNVTELVREIVGDVRRSMLEGEVESSIELIVSDTKKLAEQKWHYAPVAVVNATGVLIHTNLGRAALSESAVKSMSVAAGEYTNLEYDLSHGERGSRQNFVSSLINELTGAEASLVVNNNAAAMLLALAAISADKEVIVSRGESVEIGGGFRIPDVLKLSNAKIVEVGTTNRTYAKDYSAAVSENTGAILIVHASNFKQTGFVHSPSITELINVGVEREIPVIHDLGSGCFVDTTKFGLPSEPTPKDSISKGVEIAMFSGDKLLGGPQCGIIAGKKEVIEKLNQHPLYRAIRIDKVNLAGLTATLLHYIGENHLEEIPVLKMISQTESDLRLRSLHLQQSIGKSLKVIKGFSTIGGGSMPEETLPTWLLAISGQKKSKIIFDSLRKSNPPIISRVENDMVLLDPRTVLPKYDDILISIISKILS
jgi:L-seryl-tRNA(Ser) seleniumtransferase